MTSRENNERLATGSDDLPDTKPRTVTVLGLLALTSLTFSYLGVYAVSGALVRANVLRPWPAEADPRLRWLAISFFVLLAGFGIIAALARYLSRRQLRQIDEMADDVPQN
jgi:hypothetical protein